MQENLLNTQDEKISGGGYPVKQRKSNLDLLRALCAVFVVFMHFCEESAYNAFGYAQLSTTVGYVLLNVIYGIGRVAVPVFFLLSGYFSVNSKKQRLGKIINLFLMAIFYSFASYCLESIISFVKDDFSFVFSEFLNSLFTKNYYLYLFCALYAVSPFLNVVLKHLTKKQYTTLLVIAILLFSVWSTIMGVLVKLLPEIDFTGAYFVARTGTSNGFNIVNFTMLYAIGGYIKLHLECDLPKYRPVFIAIILCVSGITTLTKIFAPNFSSIMFHYDNVLIIVSAISMFLLFLSLDIKENKAISFVGQKAFGIFLSHHIIIRIVGALQSLESMVSQGFLGVLLSILIFVVGVYVLSLIVVSVVDFIFSPINKKWKKTKLYNYQFFKEENN